MKYFDSAKQSSLDFAKHISIDFTNHRLILFLCFVIFLSPVFAQVGIGTTSPNASAVLDLTTTTKGVLIPRMTTAQRNAIASPASGLMIFNIDDQCIDIYDGANWIKNCGMKITGTGIIQEKWFQKTNFGGSARESAVSFSIGTKGYLGTGYDSVVTNDFWEYDPVTNVWTQKANFGGVARRDAIGLAILNTSNGQTRGYLGTGTNGSGIYYNDWWEYNPSNNTWTNKAAIPTVRADAGGFVISNNPNFGYVGTGRNSSGWLSSFYKYDVQQNIWTAVEDYPFLTHSTAYSSYGDYGFIGTGWYPGIPPFVPDFVIPTCYLYHPSDQWIQIPDFGGVAKHSAVAVFMNADLFLLSGSAENGTLYKDVWKFNNNTWTQQNDFPGTARKNATGFALSNRVYFGTGNDGAYKQDFWEYEPYPVGPKYSNTQSLQDVYSLTDHIWIKEINKVYNNTTDYTGIGLATPTNKLDISAGSTRTGTHPSGRPLYITGDILPSSGVEIRANNATQGIGLGYNTIYAAGSNTDQDLSFSAKGSTGAVTFLTNSLERMRITGSGNIGIGTATANGRLQFDNGINNRKIVLYESANNDHQYYGFGLNGATLRYQVAHTSDFHIFYAGLGSGTSVELMRLSGLGKLGLGITAPANKLDINSGAARTGSHPSNLAMYITGNLSSSSNGIEFRHDNGTQGIGFGLNTIYATGSNASQDLSLAARGPSGNLILFTNGNEFFRITGNGNIGVWNSNPDEKLQVGSYGTSSNTYFKVSTLGSNQYKAGIKLRHFSDGYGWTMESDETTSLFRIKSHFNDVNGFNALTIDYSGNVSVAGVINTEAFIAPTLLNGFADYGLDYATAAYYKDKMDVVHLRGLVQNGSHSNVNIFQLPVGYRPSTSGRLIFTVYTATGASRLDISADGYVIANGSSSGWLSLNGISFRAD